MGRPLRAASVMRGKILRVARADLQDVGVLGDELHVALGQHLGDDAQVVFLGRHLQQPQALLGQALELIGRGAGLERAAAQEGRAAGLDRLGGGHELLLALDRAGAGHVAELFPGADLLPVDLDDGVLAFAGLAADQLVALLDPVDVLDLRPGGEGLEGVVGVLVADGGDDGLHLAVDGAGLVAELGHLGDDFLDLVEG